MPHQLFFHSSGLMPVNNSFSHFSTLSRLASLALLFAFVLFFTNHATAQTQQLVLESPVQSSTGFGGVASRAIDGNNSGSYRGRSVTHTIRDGSRPWWQANLESFSNVTEIRLWNRTDCCSDRLTDFYVFLSAFPFSSADVNETLNDPNVWSHFHAGAGAVGESINIPVNTSGQYVRVQLANSGVLSLAEIEVFGESLDVAAPSPIISFANSDVVHS